MKKLNDVVLVELTREERYVISESYKKYNDIEINKETKALLDLVNNDNELFNELASKIKRETTRYSVLEKVVIDDTIYIISIVDDDDEE